MEDDMAGAIGGGLPAVVAWKQLEKSGEQQRARFDKQPSVQREVDYAQAAAQKVKNVEEFLGNRRLLNFVLSAYGLESEIDKRGLLRKVLTSDLNDQNSYANRTNDPRFRELAQTLNFQALGATNIKNEATLKSIELRYKKNEFEKAQGDASPGLREALYFKENVKNVKNIYDVLGDRTLRAVVSKAFDIPLETAVQSVESQAVAFGRKFEIEKFKDKRFVEKTIQNYLTKVDQETSQSTGVGSLYGSLLTPLFDSGGISLDLLQSVYARR
jgi:Protein of unknown function (DUF1217)